jgi:ABC-2 type transport system ATP-binding protein
MGRVWQMSGTPAVVAENLVKEFKGKVRALDGLSLEAHEGAVLGLLGPNGAGKTTAVRILSTILAPDAGRATILGHDVVKEAATVRRLIGLAGQYATVDENLTGSENLRMVGRLTHLPARQIRARADELLAQFGLADAAGRPLKTYSGGMRRRLDVAAALVGRPPVLFLDEPTTGLDPQSRQDLWVVIEELVGSGATVVLTTQYLEEADRLAERIVVVDHGTVIAEGTPAELKANLGQTVVEVILADEATAVHAVALLGAATGTTPVREGTKVDLNAEDGPRMGVEVLRALDQDHVAVVGMTLREPSLDDVFLSLTGRRAEGDGPAHSDEGSTSGPGGRVSRHDRRAPAGSVAP